jgi:hypothetical protein
MTAAILNYDALHPWIEMVLVCWLCVAVVQQVLAYLRNKEAELDLRDKHKDLPPCDCGSGHNIWDCTCEVDWRDEDIERERRAGIWDD